jgi:energy-coupling factor transport system permease protein
MMVSFALLLLFQDPRYELAGLIIILVYGALAGALGNLKKIWLLLLLIGLLSFLGWAVMARGTTPLFWHVTRESLLYGLGTAIKIDAMIVAGIVFLSATRNEEVALGLIRLGLPYPAAFAFSMALRLVPTFVGAGFTAIEAQRSRGLDLDEGNVIQRARKHIPLLAPIFLNTIRSTNQLAMALEGRGFGAKKERTYYLEIGMKSADVVAGGIALILFVFALTLRLSGFGLIPGLKM